MLSKPCLGFVGKADDMKGRQPRRDLHLHIDGAGLDSLKGYRRNPLNHATLIPQRKLAELYEGSKNVT